MAKPEQVITIVREWLEKADNDLKNANHTLTPGGRRTDGYHLLPLPAVCGEIPESLSGLCRKRFPQNS